VVSLVNCALMPCSPTASEETVTLAAPAASGWGPPIGLAPSKSRVGGKHLGGVHDLADAFSQVVGLGVAAALAVGLVILG
jgi:hypothetical protein